ncbi:MAG: DUF4834 family protein [Tannerella sp.]|nr:DUF4834 family protein [Tannerella sp.]
MFKFFMILCFFAFILVSLLGFSVIRSVKSFFFGDPRSNKNRTHSTAHGQQQRTGRQTSSGKQTSRKKVIPENEGEYVDYEIVNNE